MRALSSIAPLLRTLSTASKPLRVAAVLGSTRVEGPPLPAPLGTRVGAWIAACARARGLDVDVIDPIVEDLPLMWRPHFTYPKDKVPSRMDPLSDRLRNADAYIMITPEYNHMPSPALLNLLNHFAASTFAFKPSAIVTYSSGQWGGTRAAMPLRCALSELGCLPVSALIHVPNAAQKFDADGTPVGGEQALAKWAAYADRSLSQLEWWAHAAQNQKALVDPTAKSPAFNKKPSQRNTP